MWGWDLGENKKKIVTKFLSQNGNNIKLFSERLITREATCPTQINVDLIITAQNLPHHFGTIPERPNDCLWDV